MVQLILFLVCHPSWDIRRASYDTTKKIIRAAPKLAEALLLEFTNFLSVVGEKLQLLKTRYNPYLLSVPSPLAFMLVVSLLHFPSFTGHTSFF